MCVWFENVEHGFCSQFSKEVYPLHPGIELKFLTNMVRNLISYSDKVLHTHTHTHTHIQSAQ